MLRRYIKENANIYVLVQLLKERSTRDCTECFMSGTLLNRLQGKVGYYNIHDRLPGNGRGELSSHCGDGVVILSVLLISSQRMVLLSPYFA